MSDINIDLSNFDRMIYAAVALVAIASFLIGSIPFGYLISRFFFQTDIRKQGSGNIGAMNALRTIGKGGAIAVLLLDAAKGALPVLVCAALFDHVALDFGQMMQSIAAGFAVLGHCFTPWLKFKGGKGVATSLGAIFAISWPAGLVCVAAYLVAVAITRYSSVGSMSAHVVAPFALYVYTQAWPCAAYGLFALILIVWAHRENIERLRAGTENPISLDSKRPKSPGQTSG